MTTINLVLERIISICLFFLLALIPLMVNPTAMDYWYKPKINSAYALSGIILAAALGRYIICRAGSSFKKIPGQIFLISFACSAVVSTIFSTNRHISLAGDPWRYEGIATLFTYCMLVLIFSWLVESRLQAEQLLKGLLITTTAVALYGIMQYLGYNFTEHFIPELRVKNAVGSTIGNPNFLGKYLVLIGPLFAGYCLYKNKTKIWFFCCSAYVFIVIALVLSMSTASWLGFSCAGLLFGFMLYRFGNAAQKRKGMLFGSLLAAALLILVGLAASGKGSFNIKKMIGAEAESAVNLQKGQGSSTRLFVWKRALPLIFDKPLFGYGLDTHEKVYKKLSAEYAKAYHSTDTIDRAHNNYIDLAIAQGLLGLFSYLGFISAFLIWLWKIIRNEKEPGLKILFCSLFCGFSGYLINDFFSFSVVCVSITFWSLAGLTLSLGRMRSSEPE